MDVVGCGFGRRIAELLGANYVGLEVRTFPDGEACPRVMGKAGEDVVLAMRMEKPPNDYLIDVLLAANTLRDSGATRITCVMPYLIYGRQDRAFREGEPYSLKYVLDALHSAGVDRVVTVNSHAERHKQEIRVSKCVVHNLDAMPVIADYVKGFDTVMGPDSGSERWLRGISSTKNVPYCFLEKRRDLETGRIEVCGDVDVNGKKVLIVDDIISSGGTMLKAVEIARNSGAKKVMVAAVHGLFAEGALGRLERACDAVYATNTLPHPAKEIDIVPLICGKIKSLYGCHAVPERRHAEVSGKHLKVSK